MIYALEVDAAVDAVGTVQTFLFSTLGFTTLPTDTPANTVARERLRQPASFQREMARGRAMFGALSGSYGSATLDNADGELDSFARHGFGWRRCVVRACDADYGNVPAYPAGWTTVLSAAVKFVQVDRASVVLMLRDRIDLLDKPLCTTYSGAGGADGTTQMTGAPKPRVYGSVCNIPATLVEPSDGIYQVSDQPFTQPRWAYDQRVAYTPYSANYNDAATFADLQALSIGSTAARYSDGGFVKIGGTPAGVVTVDAVRMSAGYPVTFGRSRFGEVLADICTDAGLVIGVDVDAAAVAIDTAGGDSQGLYFSDTTSTYRDALSTLAVSRGAYVGFNRLGVLCAGVVESPSGTAAWVFGPHNCIGLARVDGPFLVPVKSVRVRGGKNWRPMLPAEIDASVSASDRALLALGSVYSDTDTGAAASKFLDAAEYQQDTTSGQVSAAAPALPGNSVGVAAAALLDLFGVERDTVEVTVAMSLALVDAVDLGAVVQVRWPRFGYDAGKLFLVIGVRYDLAGNRMVFTLWG